MYTVFPDQYERFKRHRLRDAPRTGQLVGQPGTLGEVTAGPPGSLGLSGFTQDASLSESVSSLVASINAWAASEGSRVQAYIDQLETLSAVLTEFLAVPAIASEFGTQISGIVSALGSESSSAAQYLSSLG